MLRHDGLLHRWPPRDLSKEIISDVEPPIKMRVVVVEHEPMRALAYTRQRRDWPPPSEEMAHVVNHIYEFVPFFTSEGKEMGLYVYKPWSTRR